MYFRNVCFKSQIGCETFHSSGADQPRTLRCTKIARMLRAPGRFLSAFLIRYTVRFHCNVLFHLEFYSNWIVPDNAKFLAYKPITAN